jgi:hypothetical protein
MVTHEVIKREIEKGVALVISILFAYIAGTLLASLW